MRARCSSVRNGAGASSTSFWLRRCSEQSRVPTTIDVAVGVGQHLRLDVPGLVQEPLDEALAAAERDTASRTAESNSSGISSMVRATFSPRPPPPNAALMATGSPCSSAKATTSSASLTGSLVPGTSGAPTFVAMCRAAAPCRRGR